MQFENFGNKKIKRIKVNKDDIVLLFANNEQLKISKEAYLSTYLYEGKQLNDQELFSLKEITSFSSLYETSLKLIKNHLMSEKKMIDRLLKKESDFQIVNKVIARLKENNFIDDYKYMQYMIEYDHLKNYGKNKIIKRLLDQGIKEEMIKQIDFSHTLEMKKGENLLALLETKYARLAYKNKKKHIYANLINNGFDYDIALQLSQNVQRDIAEEKKLLINDFQKCYSRFKTRYEGEILKQKIYRSLVNKGYRYSDINTVMEEKIK